MSWCACGLVYTGLFISPSGTSELDCATTKTDTTERSISKGTESFKDFFVLGAMAYLQVPPLGGSRDEKWRAQWIRKRSVSWNLTKLSQLWQCNGGFGPCTAQNHLRTKQFVSGTWNSSRVAACALRNEEAGRGPLAVEPASTPKPLVKKKTLRDSLPIDMLLSAVSFVVFAQSSSEVPEGLMNNPVIYNEIWTVGLMSCLCN